MSHPSWVCGLKHKGYDVLNDRPLSHPSWVCGLKPPSFIDSSHQAKVTPFVGVWIETLMQST